MEIKELSDKKRNRRVSKHFCNLGLWLGDGELRMALWLVYQVESGEIRYSGHMLEKYVIGMRGAWEVYGGKPPTRMDLKIARATFRRLVSSGVLIKTGKKVYKFNAYLI